MYNTSLSLSLFFFHLHPGAILIRFREKEENARRDWDVTSAQTVCPTGHTRAILSSPNC